MNSRLARDPVNRRRAAELRPNLELLGADVPVECKLRLLPLPKLCNRERCKSVREKNLGECRFQSSAAVYEM